jgi:hypothetical protein
MLFGKYGERSSLKKKKTVLLPALLTSASFCSSTPEGSWFDGGGSYWTRPWHQHVNHAENTYFSRNQSKCMSEKSGNVKYLPQQERHISGSVEISSFFRHQELLPCDKMRCVLDSCSVKEESRVGKIPVTIQAKLTVVIVAYLSNISLDL